MAAIGFNDTTGYVGLRGVFPGALGRFRNFSPTTDPVGSSVVSLGTGRTTLWEYRNEHVVSLELPYLSPRVYDGESGTARAQRLIRHLLRGGGVDVLVEDDVSTAPVVSWLKSGTTPTLTLDNRQDMLYTLSVTLFNLTTRYTAIYGGVQP